MLTQLLDRIAQGGAWTVESLAEALQITPRLVEMMLQELTARGYLEHTTGGCAGACTSCAMASHCIKGAAQGSSRVTVLWRRNGDSVAAGL